MYRRAQRTNMFWEKRFEFFFHFNVCLIFLYIFIFLPVRFESDRSFRGFLRLSLSSLSGESVYTHWNSKNRTRKITQKFFFTSYTLNSLTQHFAKCFGLYTFFFLQLFTYFLAFLSLLQRLGYHDGFYPLYGTCRRKFRKTITYQLIYSALDNWKKCEH